MKEKIIDTWAVDYISQQGEKYKGQLIITSTRLMYDLNSSETPKSLRENEVFVKLGDDDYMMIKRKEINTIIITKRLFERKIAIRMKNGEEHVFDCSKFNIDSIARALE